MGRVGAGDGVQTKEKMDCAQLGLGWLIKVGRGEIWEGQLRVEVRRTRKGPSDESSGGAGVQAGGLGGSRAHAGPHRPRASERACDGMCGHVWACM